MRIAVRLVVAAVAAFVFVGTAGTGRADARPICVGAGVEPYTVTVCTP